MNTYQDRDDQLMNEAVDTWGTLAINKWETFISLVLDGQPYILAYNTVDTSVSVASVTTEHNHFASEQPLINVDWQNKIAHDPSVPPLSTKLSIFKAFPGLPYFMAYEREESGNTSVTLGRIYKKNEKDTTVFVQTWQIYWDTPLYYLTPLVIANKLYYLAYDNTKGAIYIYSISGMPEDNPEIKIVAQDDTWGIGWTTFISFNDYPPIPNGSDDPPITPTILSYDATKGNTKVAFIQSSDSGSIQIETPWTGNCASGWQSLAPMQYNYFLAYNNTNSSLPPEVYHLNVLSFSPHIERYSRASWASKVLSVTVFAMQTDSHHIYPLTFQRTEVPIAMASDSSGLVKIQSIPRPGYPTD